MKIWNIILLQSHISKDQEHQFKEKMNLSELHFVSELKWAVIYLANQSGWIQNLVSTTENKILKSPRDGIFFILNLTKVNEVQAVELKGNHRCWQAAVRTVRLWLLVV